MSSKYIHETTNKINKLYIPRCIIELLSDNSQPEYTYSINLYNITLLFSEKDEEDNEYWFYESLLCKTYNKNYQIHLPVMNKNEEYDFINFDWSEDIKASDILEEGLKMLQYKFELLFNKENENSNKIINENKIIYSKDNNIIKEAIAELRITPELFMTIYYDIMNNEDECIEIENLIFKYTNKNNNIVLNFYSYNMYDFKCECTLDFNNKISIKYKGKQFYVNPDNEDYIDLLSYGFHEIDAKNIIDSFNIYEYKNSINIQEKCITL